MMHRPDPEEVVIVSDIGIDITAEDIAGMMAIVACVPPGELAKMVENLREEDQRAYVAAYDKAILIYNDALGDVE